MGFFKVGVGVGGLQFYLDFSLYYDGSVVQHRVLAIRTVFCYLCSALRNRQGKMCLSRNCPCLQRVGEGRSSVTVWGGRGGLNIWVSFFPLQINRRAFDTAESI